MNSLATSLKLKNLTWLWISAFIILLDQLTKYFILQHFHYLQAYHITDFFNLTLTYNAGAAFSFLSQASGWQKWFFIMISSFLSIVIFIMLLRTSSKKRWMLLALALILGGALGNLCDRLTLGYVIDFIDVYIQQWHWPIFNLADSAISIGVVMLVADIWCSKSMRNED